MALIKSISGTRGTIGGAVGDNLTAQDIVESTAAYAHWILQNSETPKVVVGRDGRISGELVSKLVVSTLRMMGISVYDIGLSTTPTVAMCVLQQEVGGGIVITASHNPKQWNALKFLNAQGEFVSGQDGAAMLGYSESGEVQYAPVDKLGVYEKKIACIQKHIDSIFGLELVHTANIKARKFKVVVDCINSTGAISIIPLLEQLDCEVIAINEEITGRFAHNPEPLPENLTELSKQVVQNNAQLGIAVDPDVDRLVFVCEDGEPFGEEYTLVAIADYVLQYKKGPTVSNLSSTQALRKVTEAHGEQYYAAAVGEVNVVEKMKEVAAVIGGEGNGGIIYPKLHYGRDALVGVALFLSFLAQNNHPVSFLRRKYPSYILSKTKISLTPEINVDFLLEKMAQRYKTKERDTQDGLKIIIDEDSWVHLRRSNTEPIIRLYAESTSEVAANSLTNKIKADISEILRERAE